MENDNVFAQNGSNAGFSYTEPFSNEMRREIHRRYGENICVKRQKDLAFFAALRYTENVETDLDYSEDAEVGRRGLWQ